MDKLDRTEAGNLTEKGVSQYRREKIEQLQAEIKELKDFLSKLLVASITFQPDTNKAWQTVTVKEIIGSDKQLETKMQALKGE